MVSFSPSRSASHLGFSLCFIHRILQSSASLVKQALTAACKAKALGTDECSSQAAQLSHGDTEPTCSGTEAPGAWRCISPCEAFVRCPAKELGIPDATGQNGQADWDSGDPRPWENEKQYLEAQELTSQFIYLRASHILQDDLKGNQIKSLGGKLSGAFREQRIVRILLS